MGCAYGVAVCLFHSRAVLAGRACGMDTMKLVLVFCIGVAVGWLVRRERKPKVQTWTSKDGVTVSWYPGAWVQS